jgi:hypothetical protein
VAVLVAAAVADDVAVSDTVPVPLDDAVRVPVWPATP